MFITFLTVASLGIWGWVSSNETYWRDVCRPVIEVMDGNTARTRVIREMVVILIPILTAIWAYNVLLPPDPSTTAPIELRTYNPAPPRQIIVYSPEHFHH